MYRHPMTDRRVFAAADAGEAAPPKEGDSAVVVEPGNSGQSLLDHVADRGDVPATPPGSTPTPPADTTATPGKLSFKDRPEWLAENFWDKKTGDVDVQGLAKSQRDLREKISKGSHQVPAKPEDYKFEIADDVKETAKLAFVGGDPTKDPAMAWLRTAAHELRMSQEQTSGLVNKFLEFGQSAGLAVAPVDVREEAKKIGPNGLSVMVGVKKFVDGLTKGGTFTEGEALAVQSWFIGADDVTAFNKLRRYMGWNETPIPMDANKGGAGVTRESLRTRMGELLAKSGKGDRSARTEYETLMRDYEKAYGEEPAGSSHPG